MHKILIDTDVILDFFYDRKPYSEYSAQLLSLCESRKITGYVSPVICSNAYYILRQTSRHTKVIEKLKQLRTILQVIPMNGDVVLKALDSGFDDFKDALQNYAAVRVKQIDAVITRNVKDYRKSELAVFSPEEFLSSILKN